MYNDSLLTVAKGYYGGNNFQKAGPAFEKVAEEATLPLAKNTFYFYAAAAFAHAHDNENSFRCLDIAINKYAFNDDVTLKTADDFNDLHADKRWETLLQKIPITYSTDPLKAHFFDSDVKLFWEAYDMAQNDTAHAYQIYEKEYIGKGSTGLQGYYMYKIYNLNSFIAVHAKKHKFYNSIRKNTFSALQYQDQFRKSYVALKEIYPQAIFPNVYFVIGKLNSAGMSDSNGLVLGIDQMCRTASTDVSEIEPSEMHMINGFDILPYTVAHELIHFQQNNMASDTTLLKEAIIEGMADFIGELISGKTANERLAVFAKGRERKIWADFKKEMYLNRKQNWIANADQETADRPADLSYWVGYQICKAYYDEQPDKKKAIYDMLHIQDYRKFLEASKLDQKLQ